MHIKHKFSSTRSSRCKFVKDACNNVRHFPLTTFLFIFMVGLLLWLWRKIKFIKSLFDCKIFLFQFKQQKTVPTVFVQKHQWEAVDKIVNFWYTLLSTSYDDELKEILIILKFNNIIHFAFFLKNILLIFKLVFFPPHKAYLIGEDFFSVVMLRS